MSGRLQLGEEGGGKRGAIGTLVQLDEVGSCMQGEGGGGGGGGGGKREEVAKENMNMHDIWTEAQARTTAPLKNVLRATADVSLKAWVRGHSRRVYRRTYFPVFVRSFLTPH